MRPTSESTKSPRLGGEKCPETELPIGQPRGHFAPVADCRHTPPEKKVSGRRAL